MKDATSSGVAPSSVRAVRSYGRETRSRFGVQCLGFSVWGLGFRVQDLGFRFEGSGFGVWGLEFRV